LVESALAEQVAEVSRELQLTTGGVLWPPVQFVLTASPTHLTVSPRSEIRVKAARDLVSELPLDTRAEVEDQVDQLGDVSSLIEGTGGYSTYPAMVLESSSLEWLVETVAHEWAHNYLVFHALGWNYFDSPQMRSINETVADIVGEEVGRGVLAQFYPDLLPDPVVGQDILASPPDPSRFDFRREMRTTRVEVDRLLAEGKVLEAEAYMEARRQFFVENGYYLRKLNQAYFAFHGTYATGAAASPEDPVGQGLTRLRGQLDSLQTFLRLVQGIGDYGEFEELMAVYGIS
jgi:hypothetical protein